MVHNDFLEMIRHQFALGLDGIHGQSHWDRVRANGLRLAEHTSADAEIVELFAYLHDSRRLNDGWDMEHGQRAAEFIETLQGPLLRLSGRRLELLTYACSYHSEGLTDADITVQTCWDADRLDLGRIGIRPDPERLCTAAARTPAMIEWSFRRSRGSRR